MNEAPETLDGWYLVITDSSKAWIGRFKHHRTPGLSPPQVGDRVELEPAYSFDSTPIVLENGRQVWTRGVMPIEFISGLVEVPIEKIAPLAAADPLPLWTIDRDVQAKILSLIAKAEQYRQESRAARAGIIAPGGPLPAGLAAK